MKCQRCGGDFPHKRGRFCGTCRTPEKRDPLAVACADVLQDLLRWNAHQLVGGEAWARDAIAHLDAARTPETGGEP